MESTLGDQEAMSFINCLTEGWPVPLLLGPVVKPYYLFRDNVMLVNVIVFYMTEYSYQSWSDPACQGYFIMDTRGIRSAFVGPMKSSGGHE